MATAGPQASACGIVTWQACRENIQVPAAVLWRAKEKAPVRRERPGLEKELSGCAYEG